MSKFTIQKIEKGTIDMNRTTKFQLNRGKTFNFFNVSTNPFNNCQLFSIGLFSSICHAKDLSDLPDIIDEINNKYVNKSMCVIDVGTHTFNKIKDILDIHNSMEYVNSNTGSNMVMAIIKTSKYSEYDEDDEDYDDDDENPY